MIRKLIIVKNDGETETISINTKNYNFTELIKKYPDMDEEKTLKMDYIWILDKLIKEFPHRFGNMKNFKEDLSKVDNVKDIVLTFFERDSKEYIGLEQYNICYNLTYILKRGLLKTLMKINILLNDFKICNKIYEEIRKSSDEDDNIINIGDLLFNTKIEIDEEVDITDKVMIQINIAINQILIGLQSLVRFIILMGGQLHWKMVLLWMLSGLTGFCEQLCCLQENMNLL